jgi:hypothetical protein
MTLIGDNAGAYCALDEEEGVLRNRTMARHHVLEEKEESFVTYGAAFHTRD